MGGYTTRDVAELLGISADRVRSFARTGLLSPKRGERGEYQFSFQDIVLLRTAKELSEAHIHPRTVRRALRNLQKQLPSGRPLTAVRISAEGDQVVVRDRDTFWEPVSGQVTLDFSVSELAREAAPLVRRTARSAHRTEALTSDEWYNIGTDLETVAAIDEAKKAYRCATELQPDHVEAHINLGRILHNEGELTEAEQHYRRAVENAPRNATAWFDLGVALEDQDKYGRAIEVYRRTIALDADFADAHYNLARLYEQIGEPRAAIRHFARYKNLIG